MILAHTVLHKLLLFSYNPRTDLGSTSRFDILPLPYYSFIQKSLSNRSFLQLLYFSLSAHLRQLFSAINLLCRLPVAPIFFDLVVFAVVLFLLNVIVASSAVFSDAFTLLALPFRHGFLLNGGLSGRCSPPLLLCSTLGDFRSFKLILTPPLPP